MRALPEGDTASLERCWDALLSYPGEEDRLCWPSLPAAREKSR